MSNNPPVGNKPAGESVSGEDGGQQVPSHSYRAMNHLSLYLFIIIVYGGALITGYLLFVLIGGLLSEDVRNYPFVALSLAYARTGLPVLFILGGVVHAILSTISPVKLDLEGIKKIDIPPDRGLPLRQVVMAWGTLFFALILFVGTALLTTFFTTNLEAPVFVALLASATTMILIQIVNHQNNYHGRLKIKRAQELLHNAFATVLISPARSPWLAIFAVLAIFLIIVLYSASWILLYLLLALFLLSLSLVTFPLKFETIWMTSLILAMILLSPILAALYILLRLVIRLIFLSPLSSKRGREKEKIDD